jgi:hypothetical protein
MIEERRALLNARVDDEPESISRQSGGVLRSIRKFFGMGQ